MYNLVLTEDAQNSYNKIYLSDRTHHDRITAALENLTVDPWIGKPLKFELKGQYSLRVGLYRIIYKIEKKKVTVIILDIGHRRDVYR